MVRLTDFLRGDAGSMTQTGLVFTLLAILAGGVSVDVMRHENTRARVQQALDFCTLNAATVERPGTVTTGNTTTTNPELSGVVTACMSRLGAGSLVNTVTASSTGNFKPVSATATGSQTNRFMQMVNISTLGVAASATASVPATARVEVALAFDTGNAVQAVPGAATMRTGLKDFITRLADSSGSITPSVTLVPYSNGVNMSTTLMGRYNSVANVSNVTNVNCIDVPAADFSTVPVLTTTSGYRTMLYFDLESTSGATAPAIATTYQVPTSSTYGTALSNQPSTPCTPSNVNILRPQQDAAAMATMNTQIDALAFNYGGTRWDHGMNWAAAMLDPSANAAMGTLGSASVNTRPLAYNTADLQKVLVFVNHAGSGTSPSDGSVRTLASAYTSGNSPIYRNNSASPPTYCIDLTGLRTGVNNFYQPATNTWGSSCGSFTRLTWPQVWNSVRVSWVAWQLYGRGIQTTSSPTAAQILAVYNTWMTNFTGTISFATQEANFLAQCTAAKSAGIVVYTVGLQQVDRAKSAMRSCATSPAHYFDATTANFSDVMKVIAQTINQQGYLQ